ncbi:cytochrome p450 [Hirsutella rhossiliensis]|uniref:Cytochrome p450 domain-containing protein n=1 Tax=Hirsutella rhossiliensis TaxID=111463 RepID=A0A9P8SI99_9HYPO|nr:cytochrome p450 domain-containing protein [Hirsutella rhossiliensis]KAH0962974.1 cytochrome p450 domain-containing protein [Hirsutella rhossiliensis]
MILTLLFTAALAYVIWSLACLESNVRKARAIGVPVVRLPIDVHNIPWTTLQPLSSGPSSTAFPSDTHLRLGPAWALVTPMAIHLQFADPDAIRDMFARREDFVRPIKDYKVLEIYGPCISTAGWDDWARHRKPLAAPFNERIMTFVWEESLKQAGAMLRSWTGDSAAVAGIPSVQKDTRTLSLNVLAATGFHKSYDFHGSADGPVVDDEAGSYRDALQTVLDNSILLILVPFRYLGAPIMPKSWAKVGRAARVFKKYMEQMLQDETATRDQGKPGSGGIMTSFVYALAEHDLNPEAQNAKVSKSGKKGLSVDEIYSNLFVINFAGHHRQHSGLFHDLPVGEWDYKTRFPELKRCRAVLLETLRLHPPIMALPKWTLKKAQTLTVGGQALVIPPGISTNPYLIAIQTHPKYWRDPRYFTSLIDPYAWQPSRWISNPAASPDAMAEEKVVVPLKGTYFPWSDGPQNCPGKKFAEVEAVAVLACLFKTHRLLAKKDAGESDESARKRALACANNVDMEMLLRMVDAGRTRLICKEA